MNFENEIYAGNSEMIRYFGDPASASLVNQTPLKPAAAFRSFIDWLKTNQPEIYAGVAYTRPDLVSPDMLFEQSSFLGDVEEGAESTLNAQSVLDKTLDTLKEWLPMYYQYSSQKSLIDLNIERAKQGLTPIDSAMIAPTVKVGASSDIQKIAIFGLLGFFGLGALSILTRPKRR